MNPEIRSLALTSNGWLPLSEQGLRTEETHPMSELQRGLYLIKLDLLDSTGKKCMKKPRILCNTASSKLAVDLAPPWPASHPMIQNPREGIGSHYCCHLAGVHYREQYHCCHQPQNPALNNLTQLHSKLLELPAVEPPHYQQPLP